MESRAMNKPRLRRKSRANFSGPIFIDESEPKEVRNIFY